jgi:hypothetical protein
MEQVVAALRDAVAEIDVGRAARHSERHRKRGKGRTKTRHASAISWP